MDQGLFVSDCNDSWLTTYAIVNNNRHAIMRCNKCQKREAEEGGQCCSICRLSIKISRKLKLSSKSLAELSRSDEGSQVASQVDWLDTSVQASRAIIDAARDIVDLGEALNQLGSFSAEVRDSLDPLDDKVAMLSKIAEEKNGKVTEALQKKEDQFRELTVRIATLAESTVRNGFALPVMSTRLGPPRPRFIPSRSSTQKSR
jgi:hypothetical protein